MTSYPVWLVEGLNEMLLQDDERNRESIVKRAAMAERAPSLSEVLGWQDISDDRLLGIYQRAFCYYLVRNLIHNGDPRARFHRWLDLAATSGLALGAAALSQ